MTILPGIKEELLRAEARMKAAAAVAVVGTEGDRAPEGFLGGAGSGGTILPRVRDELLEAERRQRAGAGAGRRRGRASGRGMPVWRPLGAVTGLAVAAALAAVFLLGNGHSTSRAAALPVLDGPANDITALSGKLTVLKRSGAAFTQARKISTPNGTGYVTPTHDGAGVCIAVPDGDAEGFAQACTPLPDALVRGLLVEVGVAHGPLVALVAALPARPTSATIVNGPSASSQLPIDRRGVLNAAVVPGTVVRLVVGTAVRLVPTVAAGCRTPPPAEHPKPAPCHPD